MPKKMALRNCKFNCGYASLSSYRIKRHEDNTHSKFSRFVCKKCNYKTSRNDLFYKHKETRMHKINDKRVCNFIHTQQKQCKERIYKHHIVAKKSSSLITTISLSASFMPTTRSSANLSENSITTTILEKEKISSELNQSLETLNKDDENDSFQYFELEEDDSQEFDFYESESQESQDLKQDDEQTKLEENSNMEQCDIRQFYAICPVQEGCEFKTNSFSSMKNHLRNCHYELFCKELKFNDDDNYED